MLPVFSMNHRLVRRLRPLIVKEFRQIRRDPTSLGMLLFLPAALIVLVGYALNFDVKHIPLATFDQDKTNESGRMLRVFKETEYFDHRFEADSYEVLEQLFNDGEAKAAVVIPRGFGQEILAGRGAHVQILVDGSDANSASQAVAYASWMIGDYGLRVVDDAFFRYGFERYDPVDFRPRVWYNPDLISSKFLVPGLIGFILVLTAVVSTSLTVVREKERGTMEQIMVSPLRPFEIILGKTIPYLIISLVAAALILLLGYLLFSVEINGSILLLFFAILLLGVGALGQGLLISTITNSQQVAFMISVFSSLLPSFLLSGFVFPVANMPVVLQIVSNMAVAKFFLVVCRGIMLKGVGFGALWQQFAFMAMFACVVLTISIMRMQKRTIE